MTEKRIIRHQSLRMWMPIFSVLLISEFAFFITKAFKVQLHGPAIPLDWGLIKDLVDVISVMLFPWHGWVFGSALLTAYLFKPDKLRLMILLFSSSILTSTISTHFNFRSPSIINFATGAFTYFAINLFVFTLIHSIKTIFQRGLKCLR